MWPLFLSLSVAIVFISFFSLSFTPILLLSLFHFNCCGPARAFKITFIGFGGTSARSPVFSTSCIFIWQSSVHAFHSLFDCGWLKVVSCAFFGERSPNIFMFYYFKHINSLRYLASSSSFLALVCRALFFHM